MAEDFWDDNDQLRAEAEAEEAKYRARRNAKFSLTRLTHIELDDAPRCTVEDLIPRDGMTLVWGPPKCGKTFWTFDLAGHVAGGRPYCGREVEQGAVVYIGCEGEHGLRARAIAFRQARLAEDEDPPLYLMMTRLDLVADIDELIVAVRSQLDGQPCVKIVIDTLNRSLRGSESKDEDMSSYVLAADRLREVFRCAVILIHHCGVAGDRPRGHTSLTGAIDAQIAVQKDADGTILVTLEMMKDGPGGDMMRCQLKVIEVGIDKRGKPITSCVIEHLGAADASDRRGKKLSAAQNRALALLGDAIGKAGEIPPASDHIPSGTLCVREKLWREYCDHGAISEGNTPDARGKAFKRAADVLVDQGRVGKWEPWVWLIR